MRCHYLILSLLCLTQTTNGFLQSISALNEFAELGKKVLDFFGDDKAQTAVGVMLSKTVTADKKIELMSQLSENTIQNNEKLKKLDQELKGHLNDTLSGLRNNLLMKRTIDNVLRDKLKGLSGVLQNGSIEQVPVTLSNQANKQLVEALYQNGKLTIQLANNISGLGLSDGTQQDSLIIDLGRAISTKFENLALKWEEKLTSLLNGVSANKMLIESFQGKVMAGLDLLGREMNFSATTVDTFKKNLEKTFDVCFDTTVQNIEAKLDRDQGLLEKLRLQIEPQFDVADKSASFNLNNFWKETSSVNNVDLLVEMEELFERKIKEHLATHYFNDNEPGPLLERSISLIQKTMEGQFKSINEQLAFQNTDLKNFIENKAHLDRERKFIEDVLVPINLTMEVRLEYLRFKNPNYWDRFSKLYTEHKIFSIPEKMRIYYEGNLKELLEYEKRKDHQFDFQAYEHFRGLYIWIYQMAWDLRQYQESHDVKNLDIKFLQRESEKKDNATKHFNATDHRLRKDVATLEFNHYAKGEMTNSVNDLSDELSENEFKMIFSYFYKMVNAHVWKDTGKPLNKYFLLYSNISGECRKQSFTVIHEGHHHGHLIRKNSTEGAQFFLFREHDEIGKAYWQDLLTQIYDGFSNLDPFASNTQLSKDNYLESLRQASHEAVVKICAEKINNKHKCKFVLTTRDRCLYPRESKESFVAFVGPHKSIKIVIGL